jgi:hypothetical protein
MGLTMANFLSCTGTVQSLLSLYNKMFAETAKNHEQNMIGLAKKVSELAVDITTKTTNAASTLKHNSEVAATKIGGKIETYVQNLKNQIKVESGANFAENQETQYQNVAYSTELNADSNVLKAMFSNFYNQAFNFTSSTLMDVLDTPYKVNTAAIFTEAIATPVNDKSCFAIKGQVKAQLETQKDGINQAFFNQYAKSVSDAKSYFSNVKTEISGATITVNNTAACNAVVDSITKEAIDLFASSISNADHNADFYANNTDIQLITDSFKQDVCVTDLASVVTEINSGLEVLGQINVVEIA